MSQAVGICGFLIFLIFITCFQFDLGNAFLWHQIRAIMAVLLLVGQENEKPEIIRELLDVENNPCTPQYRYRESIHLN